MKKNDVVAVFGSARIGPDQPVYKETEKLGGMLAKGGFSVITGGYGGVMEAASKGAKKAGGHVIGVTVNMFESSGLRAGPNGYIDEFVGFDLLSDRMIHIVKNCDAAIACGGGLGTMSEITTLWSLIQTGELPKIPLIMIGEMWEPIFTQLASGGDYISDAAMSLAKFALTPEDAYRKLVEWE